MVLKDVVDHGNRIYHIGNRRIGYTQLDGIEIFLQHLPDHVD
jgi:hypothetical protein